MIRLARPADAAFLRACAEAAYARYVPEIGRRPAPMDADFPAQIAAGQVSVAEDVQGMPQGYVVCVPRADHMLLESVAVHPRAVGQGLGRLLIAHCETLARAQALPEVRLYTNAKMAANLGLYPHLGYRETGRGVENGFDRVYFAKVLG
ncbi:N-acetyltransferase [Gemmobacter lanyuensis]|uniref:N-acetyltransferase n=1 Tax=Gemmobacter lanyuensis TaxID=1054497 RepID=A0A918IXA9_9RHOB|nr:GNAT family N-acetyltransferase [Gemmobacter lanyuensis]GGW36440.1 N-acetyltransferase [Gemmobacter lanyuensis]